MLKNYPLNKLIAGCDERADRFALFLTLFLAEDFLTLFLAEDFLTLFLTLRFADAFLAAFFFAAT